MSKKINSLNDFKKELTASKSNIVLIDFYADWCGPCVMLGKELEKINMIDIIKVNVDNGQDIIDFLKVYITSIPHIILYSIANSKIIDYKIGFCDKEEIESWIKKHL